jgi:hypothetical protein
VLGQLFSEIFVEMLVGQKGQEEGDSEIEWENIGNFVQDGLPKVGDLLLLAIQNAQNPVKLSIDGQQLLEFVFGHLHELAFEVFNDLSVLEDGPYV